MALASCPRSLAGSWSSFDGITAAGPSRQVPSNKNKKQLFLLNQAFDFSHVSMCRFVVAHRRASFFLHQFVNVLADIVVFDTTVFLVHILP
jgi:hypothetical protein